MEHKLYKVSVLVPIYGVEHYIKRCAESIFSQSYENIEYVFVNDCTKDKSIEVLTSVIERFPQRKKQIKIIKHKENKGIASSRNTAVNNCTGDFLVQVDSDDWTDTTLVEKLVDAQIKSGADIVTADYYSVKTNGNHLFKATDIENPKEILTSIMAGKYDDTRIWGRLIRTSLYKDNHVALVDGANFAEDLTGLVQLMFFARKHIRLKEPLYFYECRNLSSYSKTFSAKSSIQSLANNDYIYSFFSNNAPEYLPYVKIMELKKTSGHMILCCRNRENKKYYNEGLLPRIAKTDRRLWSSIPLKNRIALYLRNFELVRLYVLVGNFIKR